MKKQINRFALLIGTAFIVAGGSTAVFSAAPAPAAPAATPEAEYWLRPYPLEPYAEYWHLNFTVADLKKTLPQVISLLEKNKGQSNIPLGNSVSSDIHHYQQLSYRISSKSADKVIKKLKKLGKVESLTTIPASSLVDMPEVTAKLSKLKQETAANQEALAKMPSVSALVSELVAHLDNAQKTYAGAKGNILLNIELQESPAK